MLSKLLSNGIRACEVLCFTMVRHIPQRIRQLLTLHNPDAFPGPSVARLNHLFEKTWTDASLKGAETGWLVLTVRMVTVISMSAQTDFIRLVHC
jgi:hypothetical protein